MRLPRDWLPKSRAAQLAMAGEWVPVCTAKQSAWNIPQADLTTLSSAWEAAAAALEAATNESTRTPVTIARCKTMFSHLVSFMRYFKQHYFMSPPLSEADLVSLGLKPHDPHPTPSGVPTAQVAVETHLAGRHQIGVRMVYVSGNPIDPANKGFHIWFRIVRPGETPPQNPDELNDMMATKRHSDLLEFAYGDSGSTVYIAAQVVNGKLKGGFGPMTSALIP